ncbi:hypothetical protein [Streptomyces longwoodensis]|uniref:hypothetical protein n=1 Tax=Streptomyces longwoodensis TaxID=68231 RepID=UPI003F4B110E
MAGASIAAGALCLAGLTPHTSVLLAAYLLIGIGFGFGFANAPITNTAVNGLPPARAGVAGAITSTARQLGTALAGNLVTAAIPAGLGKASRPGWALVAACGELLLLGPHSAAEGTRPCSEAGRQRAMRTAARRASRGTGGNPPTRPDLGEVPRPARRPLAAPGRWRTGGPRAGGAGSVQVVPRPRRGGTSVRLTPESEPFPVRSQFDEQSEASYGRKSLSQANDLLNRSGLLQRPQQQRDVGRVIECGVRDHPPGQDSDLLMRLSLPQRHQQLDGFGRVVEGGVCGGPPGKDGDLLVRPNLSQRHEQQRDVVQSVEGGVCGDPPGKDSDLLMRPNPL